MKKEYPIIKLPYKLEKIKDSEPRKPSKPSKPSKPYVWNTEYPTQPKELSLPKHKEVDSEGCFSSLTLYSMLIAFVTVLGITFGAEWDEDVSGTGFFMIGVLIIGGVALFVKNSMEDDNKKQYEIKRKKIETKNEALKANYENQKKEYHKRIKLNEAAELEYQKAELKYQKALKEYDVKLAEVTSISYIKRYREQLFDDFISEIKFKHQTITNAKKGVSEALFFEYLSARFKGNIHTCYSIDSDYEFTPDFTYYDEGLGFFIDIEIDEPYVGETGKPIHFLYEDDYRNGRFTSRGWIVVRFAEEQVTRFPNECCDVIEQIVVAMKNKTTPVTTPTSLKKVARWTKEESQKMAIERYRNTYLNIKFNEVADYDANVYYEPPVHNDENGDYYYDDENYEIDEDYARGR